MATYIKQHDLENFSVLAAHAKCGVNTFRTVLADFQRSWQLSDCIARLPGSFVVISVRDPFERLFSAWRRYTIKQILREPDNPDYRVRPVCSPKLVHKWCKFESASEKYIEDPVSQWDRFCNSKFPARLSCSDPHFTTQYSAYKGYLNYNWQAYSSIDEICYHFGKKPKHLNIGPWPWKNLTINDFDILSARKIVRKLYVKDQWLFNNSL